MAAPLRKNDSLWEPPTADPCEQRSEADSIAVDGTVPAEQSSGGGPRRVPTARKIHNAPLHPLATEFLHHLGLVNERWHQNAAASCRHFCTWLLHFMNLPPGTDFGTIDLVQVTPAILGSYMHQLEMDYPNRNTLRANLYALRRWFRYLVDHGHLARDPSLSLPTIPRQAPALNRLLTPGQVAAFFEAVGEFSPFPERDTALFGLLANLGLRPGEALGMTAADIDVLAGLVKVHGKGNRERLVPLNGPLLSAIERYLFIRRSAGDDEALWVEKGTPLSGNQLRTLFHRYRSAAGIPATVGGPHVFRHFFITQNLLAGANLRDLAAVVGHSNVRSLESYFHTTTELLRTELQTALQGGDSDGPATSPA